MNALILSLALMQTAFAAAGQDKATLLFLPFEAASGEHRALENGLPDVLTACLAEDADTVQVVDRGELSAMAGELGLAYEAAMDSKSVAQIGRLASSRFLVHGSFRVNKGMIDMEILLNETETTRLLGTAELSVSVDSPTSGCDAFRAFITGGLEKGQASPELAYEKNPALNQHMMKGLGYYYNGEFWKAFPEFLKALEIDNNSANARFWLGKSYDGAGMPELAQVSLEEFVHNHPGHAKRDEAQKLLNRIRHENP